MGIRLLILLNIMLIALSTPNYAQTPDNHKSNSVQIYVTPSGKITSGTIEDAIQEMKKKMTGLREVFPGYPKVGMTYLSYDPDHNFQVTYYENEKQSWLWYGGNKVALPAEWKMKKRKSARSSKSLFEETEYDVCWKYGPSTYNPSTKKRGGKFSCMNLFASIQLKVGVLEGDVFNLSTGKVPYEREKCDAPNEFTIIDNYSEFRPLVDCK